MILFWLEVESRKQGKASIFLKPYVKPQTYGNREENIQVPLIYIFGNNFGRPLTSAEKTIPKKL